ncbi:AEC family transporter [Clostridium fungisolvens]|uniref:Malate transporter n=1 Tax=Clostridium fungisolvens TaxID=1604897 RepID=A0A6V8SF78_9CLOT|nr:AEC family transporter [Clostridium fungisolvens]GFP75451.1 hypothetical protein bsdtw1_01531 [Clostridium fungisolvens]
MSLINSMQSVLCILLMISVGYFFSRIGWFNDGTAKLFSKVVVNIAVPGYMISNLISTYDRSKLICLAGGVLIPYTSMIICYVLGTLIAKAIKLPSNRRGIFAATISISNTLFVGLPVNVALFGDSSIPFVFIYFIANVSLFWTIGAYGISRDGGREGHIFSKENLKKMVSPPLCAFIIAVILIFVEASLPKFLKDTFKYMGNMLTPLSMLYIGITIYNIDFKEMKWDKSMSLIVIGRFVISPLLVFFLCSSVVMPVLMKKVFIIQSAMPAMSVTSVLAEAGGGDHKYAAIVTTMTTIATLLFLPIYIILLSKV